MGAIVAAVMTFYCGTACGIGIWKAVVIGAVSGAAGAAANGGNIFKGALIGGLSGAAFHGIGDSFGIKTGDFFGTKLSIGDFISKTALHGLMGGVMSVLQGGKFGHGFASAGVTQAFSGQIDRLDINTAQSAQRVIAAAVVGGTTSVISGGKFGNGAVTGAFSRALNDETEKKTDEEIKAELARTKLKLQLTRSLQAQIKANGDIKLALSVASNLDLSFDSKTGNFSGDVKVGQHKYLIKFSGEGFESIAGSFSRAAISLSNFSGSGFDATFSLDPITVGPLTLWSRQKVTTSVDFEGMWVLRTGRRYLNGSQDRTREAEEKMFPR